MSSLTTYWLWVAAMTLALLIPVSRLIWVFSVRRLQKKLQKTLSEAEIRGQKNRAYLIGFVVCLIFSMLFNFKFLG